MFVKNSTIQFLIKILLIKNKKRFEKTVKKSIFRNLKKTENVKIFSYHVDQGKNPVLIKT